MRTPLLIFGASLMALSAAGCDRTPSAGEPLPLTTAAYEPLRPAPSVEALPAAAPARLAYVADARDAYGYYDRAYDMGYAFDDAPPDYAFDYDGVEPWVWETDDGWGRYIEPLGYGDRYYYYGPDGDYPFLVRDPDYAYGYDRGGRLVVVYDRDGRVMPRDWTAQRAGIAGRYLARAEALRAAAKRERRQAIAESNWAVRQGRIAAERERQARLTEQRPDWRAYRQARAEETRPEARWGEERRRRAAEAHRAQAQMRGDREAARVTRLWRRDTPAPAPMPVTVQRPQDGQDAKFAERQARAQAKAQQQAERQAEAQARVQQQAQAVAQRQADAEVRARRQSEARMRPQAQAQARAQAQAGAQARKADVQAVRQAREQQQQAQVQARQQAQAQARQQQQAERQAQAAAQAQARQQAQAQRQAQVTAQQQAKQQARDAKKAAREAAKDDRPGKRD